MKYSNSNAEMLCSLRPEPLSNEPEKLQRDYLHYLNRHYGRFLGCDSYYIYSAMALVLRDRLTTNWHDTWVAYKDSSVKRACYMSLEYLIGRSLGNHILNADLGPALEKLLMNRAVSLEDIEEREPDAGLGNGGLGRLAACFIDSCATLQLPVVAYGLRYEYGMFRQKIENGRQIEEPDHWLRDGNPWEIERSEYTATIKFGGRAEEYYDADNIKKVHWVETQDVLAIPYDLPVSGYKNNTVNTLRLWKATATDEFNLDEFNAGSYTEAVSEKNNAEHITMVLYPNDVSENGKVLRLRQQYFLASATLQDVIRIWEKTGGEDYSKFPDQNVFQMNDTHPTIAVAELMRILIDEKGLEWDQAWDVTTKTMAYTNHTLLPEALEKWPVPMFEQLLPRLLEIIYQINARFLELISMKWPGDTDRQRRMSIIEEGGVKHVRMAYLAIVGSFSVNGVAALHSRLLAEGLFHDFYDLWPEKFNNKTNGVTPRRWIAYANPAMKQLVSEKIGENWISDLSEIERLKAFAPDTPENREFHQAWRDMKRQNKQRLANLVETNCGVIFNVDSLFDIQVKRIHEYKRQLLNVLHVIHLYNRIKAGDTEGWVNRCVLIGGKAAPGYQLAKQTIKLINNVAHMINDDPAVGERLKLVYYSNYGVTAMEAIAPGADLSEQVSTAGKEASGTGNMKFMMNGAITIGTYDGANIEILEAVGEENFFLFGLRAEEVEEQRHHYNPQSFIDTDEDLKAVMNLLESGYFNLQEPGIFNDIINSLKSPHDPWMTLADFRSYIDAQHAVEQAWRDQEEWTKMSILNTASSGFFSTDRTMLQYNEDIWKLKQIPVHSPVDV
ncbi:glycogen phosphorylase [Solemya velum gill symbiont]|uniref:glycogen/starch/alpha-glucan phosphorylase n=1 Tax=Solemya velum gill symbiont TaxID=2340 RepID=UPI0009968B56|nr:glycogen/starch/alpha-glucan phosphorylase [Solemya velum gill symbiont]OOY52793.1 glycogen phosphorylase [Solemya velum gill symbiont]